MCGFTGFISKSLSDPQNTIVKMIATLSHRGPDDEGIWVDNSLGIALGHRRLAILDLSPNGHQPMTSRSGRYVIVYNGEVYNFSKLVERLSTLGHSLLGQCDTEVVLAAVEEWGLQEAVKQFNGMFSFALWDRKDQVLHLVRDRLGKKPLYYGWIPQAFIFGSELKPFLVYPSFPRRVRKTSLTSFLRYGYVPAPESIYEEVFKLFPGCILSLPFEGLTTRSSRFSANPHTATSSYRPNFYWSAKSCVEEGQRTPFSGNEGEAATVLETLLRDAVKIRTIADVPVGAFLSGGVDSSLVVALMQAQSTIPVKTFTIGFHEDQYDEAKYASKVAQHLGTDHTELYLTAKDSLEVIPKLPRLYDEPFADCSQIPTYLVSTLARKSVTVALSGDGGDELFSGYNRYVWANTIRRCLAPVPGFLRQILARTLTANSPEQWDRLFTFIANILPRRFRYSMPGDKLHKLADMIRVSSTDELYHRLVSHWNSPSEVVVDGREEAGLITDPRWRAKLGTWSEMMMYLDLISYLPDDILVKVDRASMGVSLEARAPLIDYRVVEFAWTLPLSMKMSRRVSKKLLREILYRYVPQTFIERAKMGFGVPIDSWLRGSLRDWAETLLDEKTLREQNYFHADVVRKRWSEHLSGKRNWQYSLWTVLMFQAWVAEYHPSSA